MSKATPSDIASVVETIAVAFSKKSDIANLSETLLNIGKDTLETSCAVDHSIPRPIHLALTINEAWQWAAVEYNAGQLRGTFGERIQQLHMFEIDTSLTKPFVSPIFSRDEETVLTQARSITWVWRTTDTDDGMVSELLCTVSLGFVAHTKIIVPTGDRSTDMALSLTDAISELLRRVDIVDTVAYPKVGVNGLRVSTTEVLNNALAIGYDFSVHGDATITTCNIDFPLWGQTRSVRTKGTGINREAEMTKALTATLDALVFDFAEGEESVQRSLKAIRALRESQSEIV